MENGVGSWGGVKSTVDPCSIRVKSRLDPSDLIWFARRPWLWSLLATIEGTVYFSAAIYLSWFRSQLISEIKATSVSIVQLSYSNSLLII